MNKFVILSSNYTEIAGVGAEHGLSLAILVNNQKILFDTGQSDLFLRNTEKIGIDIKNPDSIVISHNHYDHTGGLGSGVFAKKLYYPADFGEKCFRKLKKGVKTISSPFSKDFLTSVSKELVSVNSVIDTDFGKIILTTGETEFYKDSFCQVPYLMNELSIVVSKTLFVGCSHTGIGKIIETALYSGCNIDTVVGGFHTRKMSDEKINDIIKMLKNHNIKKVYPFHCSGLALNNRLKMAGVISTYPSTGNSFDI